MSQQSNDIRSIMRELGFAAREASRSLAIASSDSKKAAIVSAAAAIEQDSAQIIAANELDLSAGTKSGLGKAMLDRLMLNENRISQIANALREIAVLQDPVGTVITQWQRPNGLDIQRVRTPLGVIGVIYESRPNVTADAGALCLLAGNAVILRGGSDSIHSSTAILQCLKTGLKEAKLPSESIQMVPVVDRAAVGAMLEGLNGNLDVIVPRGGKGLVQRVQENCRVPVFAHLEGICHVYVDASSDVAMAADVVFNSKMRRPGICGAAESVLVQKAAIESHLDPILNRLADAGCEIRGDATVCERFKVATLAAIEDWSTEYLDAIVSVKIVNDVAEAIEHIQKYSSGHTESIISEDPEAIESFLGQVDSAILMHNTSTQFADGGEFGMGAEIGIATGKMHARGPVGVEQLTSFNYRVRGSGQVRE